MGVTGLWRLIEPAGKPVPVETLENKVLAVDISIWLHQMVKGYQDAKGAPLPNAHLMGLFQRLCKLLYFRIKPIFVFDGAFPDLKKETIAKRQDSKAKYHSESERLKRELALILSKKTAVNTLLGKQISPKKSNPADSRNDDDIFKLPSLPEQALSESESEDEQDSSSSSIIDVHSVDIESDTFKTMPAKEKYELLIELKETRKMNSWGKIHQLPKKSDNFSDYQMERLLKRRKVQECLEETEKEMGDTGMSLNDLESLLNEEGIDTKTDSLPGRRIASDNTTRFLLISNVKQALADAKKKKELEKNPSIFEKDITKIEQKPKEQDEVDEDLEKAIKMSLECAEDVDPDATSSKTADNADKSACTSKTDDSWTSFGSESDNTDSEEEDGFEEPESMSSAKAYIMQYTDFTHKTIDKMITRKNKKTTCKVPEVDQIIEELNKEKSVIVDNVDLSSSDDEVEVNTSEIDANVHRKGVESDESFDSFNASATQASVVCLGNPTQEIISLDSSVDEKSYPVNQAENDNNVNPPQKAQPEIVAETTIDDTTSDEEFEDVPDIETKLPKPVVELVLNVGKAPDNDIFADIFGENEDKVLDETKAGPSGIVIKNETIDDSENSDDSINYDSILCKDKDPSTLAVEDSDIIKSKGSNRVTIKEPIKITADPKINDTANKSTELETDPKITKEVANPNALIFKETVSKEPERTTTEPIINETTNKSMGVENHLKIIKEIENPVVPISEETLDNMAEELQSEEQNLLREKGRLDRVGRNITEQMTKEAQELLQIFGIPYIVAPMEAEAQCAFLENVKLTDGTITDDSDIWLFGGRTVYKNFFNQKKHVLQFLAERIERSFNLAREQLILLALLVGSDYTTGVTGVGPVTALEILASFPFNKKQLLNEATKQAQYAKIVAGLQEFKQWVRAGKRTDNTTLKKKLRNVEIGDDFPSVRVVQAYLEPNVEKSEEKFTWGELDVAVLRDYTRAKFGWSQTKFDEIVNPVLKRLQDRKSQKTVHDYFKRKIEFQCLEEQMSKRVKAAVQKMGPEENVAQISTAEGPKPKVTRKRKTTKQNETVEANKPPKQTKTIEDEVLSEHKVTVVSQITDGKSSFEITIPKTDRYQEIIPQREKEKRSLLENKMKAIETFRKTKLDKKKKNTKRRPILPKEKAELSESDSD